MFKIKGFIFSVLLALSAGNAFAEIMELDNGLTIDMDSRKEVKQACTPVSASNPVPGSECIVQCYDVANNTNTGSSCVIEGTASYYEVFVMTNPDGSTTTMETGNTLAATDIRNLILFPYSVNKVCFNYGKYTGDGLWVYDTNSATIGGTCKAVPSTMGEPGPGTPTAPPTGGTNTILNFDGF